jgi:predicted ATPase/DNA-binding CsgD family transcriptional regulator
MALSTRSLLLPAQPTPLVGRADELATIRQRLADEGMRLLTLTGPGGVGKTRLALAAAEQLADQLLDRFPDGVVVVDLTPVRDPHLVLPAIARTLGLTDTGHPQLSDRLRDFLRERVKLLVLDNFEQVLPAAGLLADLLASCPDLALLVTSRVPLQLRWEQTLRIAPLPIPDLRAALPPLDALLAVPSVALFVERARARRADFVLGEKQAPLVAQLAVELDGLPLALELAAARLDVLSLPTLVRRLEDRLRLLTSEAPDRPERQRSLEAAVGWSYDLLSEPERRLFRCLGVFVGRVSLDAITAVVSGVSGVSVAGGDAGEGEAREVERTLPRLLSLAEKSLVLPLPGQQHGAADDADDGEGDQEAEDEGEDEPEPAFGMLETVREYAQEQLVAAGELAVARGAHAHYFLALAERADRELRGRDQRAWLFRLERERDNLQAALRWLLDQDGLDGPAEREAGLRLAGALGDFWWFRGYHAEGRRWLEEALARAQQGAGADLAARTRALVFAGAILTNQGDFARARALLEEALALARRRQDLGGIVQALTFLGACAMRAGHTAEAVPLQEEALRRARELGEPSRAGVTLNVLGAAAQAQGHASEAAAHHTEALAFLEAAGDVRTAGAVHFALVVLAGQRGDPLAAARHLRAGLAASVRLRDRWLLSQGVEAVVAVVGDSCDRVAPVGCARLQGAADALRQATGAGHPLWEPVAADPGQPGLRAHHPEGEWEAAYREGRSLSFGEVAALALTLLDEVARPRPGAGAEGAPAVSAPPAQSEARSPHNPLSEREAEVVRLVAEGLSNKAIGRKLFIAPTTVNYHLTSIFNKLGVDTRAQAVAVAVQRRLL